MLDLEIKNFCEEYDIDFDNFYLLIKSYYNIENVGVEFKNSIINDYSLFFYFWEINDFSNAIILLESIISNHSHNVNFRLLTFCYYYINNHDHSFNNFIFYINSQNILVDKNLELITDFFINKLTDDSKFLSNFYSNKSFNDFFNFTNFLLSINKKNEVIFLYFNYFKFGSKDYFHFISYQLAFLFSQNNNNFIADHYFKLALSLSDNFIVADLNYGIFLEKINQIDAAIKQWNLALENPNIDLDVNLEYKISILNNLGRVFENQRNFDEAEHYLYKSLLIDNKQGDVIHHWTHLRQKQCKWPLFDGLNLSSNEALLTTSPLGILAITDNPSLLMENARKFVSKKVDKFERLVSSNHRYSHKKIKIGYLSSNLSMHAVSLLMVELFEKHNRQEFEIHAFCWSPEDNTKFHERVKNAFDFYHSIVSMSDIEAAHFIKELEIDILFDLQGLTAGARPNIVSLGPVPVQISYLGYPSTSGIPNVDYIIADPFIIKPDMEQYFTEKPLYLPKLFQVCDNSREVLSIFTKKDFGFNEDDFVFCAFNNNFKITPFMFASWMKILLQCDNSKLWILEDNIWAKNNLINAAKVHGVSSDRLVFAGRIEPSQYLARFECADLFLDTFPFNAGTTANDVLWSGLPLLTLSGNSYSSRMAGSLLNSIGLNDFITYSFFDYEKKAVDLFHNRETIFNVKRFLKNNRENNSLFSTNEFVFDLEEKLKNLII